MSDQGQADQRYADLQKEVEKLRIRERSPDAERRLRFSGVFASGLGLLLIFLGYWGASGTNGTYEHIPYLISGGIGGLALILMGGFVTVRAWVVAMNAELVIQSERQTQVLERIEALLAERDE